MNGSGGCALLAGGTVACWGLNADGQLGDGMTVNSSTPVPVSGVSGATAITVEGDTACALVAGVPTCWGSSVANPVESSSTPAALPGLVGLAAISLDNSSACDLLASGEIECWGSNNDGQLGDGTTVSSSTPAPVVW
jgi:alpha-tubulin suppressor-like RCC1 family protein